MISINPGLYVRVEQLETGHAPQPEPLANGFSPDRLYLVLGAFSPSETGEAYLILSNDANEIWFISNRHLRTHSYRPSSLALRLPLPPRETSAGRSAEAETAAH